MSAETSPTVADTRRTPEPQGALPAAGKGSRSQPEASRKGGLLEAGPLRLRALALGAALMAANQVWITYLEIVRYSMPTYVAPFFNVVFTLVLVTAANLGIARWRPGMALNRLELLAIYAMLSVGSALHSSDMLGVLVALMGYPHYFANDSNQWGRLFLRYLPDWLTVRDPVALRGFYSGSTTLYHQVYLRAWVIPVFWWTLFALALAGTLFCLSTLLSRHWMARERLTYPVVELPFQISAGEPFFRQRRMWVGLAITAATTLLNGLNYLYPSVPYIPLKRQVISTYFPSAPWNAMGSTNISFYPFAISLCFLMPQDLSFSAWLFYLFYKAELVISAAAGWSEGQGNRFPYHQDQAFGAYLCILLFTAWKTWKTWKSRRVLAQPVRSLLGKAKGLDEETGRERAALVGAVVGSAFLIGFAIRAGMTWWLAMAFFALYFGLAVLASRIRVELGFPVIDLSYTQPHEAMVRMFGSDAFGARDLSVFGMFHWFNRIYRSQPLPHMAEAAKLADRSQSPQRAMLIAVAVALAAAVPLSFWSYLDMYYRRGAASSKVEIWSLGFGREMFNRLASWIKTPTQLSTGSMEAAAVGFTLAGLLAAVRSRCVWFPLHPLAYAVANGWGMHNLWSCVFIGWALKVTVLRYGGLQRYRSLIPFFLGLMLGEFMVGSVWTLIGIVLDVRTYDFWP